MPAFAIYTFLTIVMTLFMNLTANPAEKPALTLSTCIMFFVMSLLISASSLIFYVKTLSILTRTVINFFLTLASIIIVALFGNYDLDASSLVLVLVYTILYLIFVPVGILIYTAVKKHYDVEDDYKSMFSSDKK